MKKYMVILAVTAAIMLCMPTAARAESITSTNADVVITRQGQADFTETINYFFTKPRRGIFRDIPVTTVLPDRTTLNYVFQSNGVTRDGNSEPTEQSDNGAYQRLKIGNPSLTLDGQHEYVIRYTLSPVVRRDPQGDYITINLHGTRWEVGANKVSGSVTLPSGVIISDAICYTGSQGSRAQDCRVEQQGSRVIVTANQALAAGEGLTVDILTPSESFNAPAYNTPAAAEAPPSKRPPVSGIVWLVFSLLTLIAMVYTGLRLLIGAIRRRKGKTAQTIVAQYDAPDNMSPGEVGLIHDEKGAVPELTATLIDLARRGWIKIEHIKVKTWLPARQNDFIFTQLSGKDTLKNYEKILLSELFKKGSPVKLSEADKSSMASTLEQMVNELEQRMKDKGWFAAKEAVFSSDKLTQAGYVEWAKVEGLKLYLNVAEKDRMKFAEAPVKTPERFTKLLPFAIALGVEKEWAKQFAGIDISSATHDWYSGGDIANATILANTLSGAFSSSVQSAFVPPSSSGGFGGGFSGGGVGGGGGGSW